MIDAWRLALGTLTVLPVRPPRGDPPPATLGRAMLLAPFVGALLGSVAAAVGWAASQAGLGSLVVASLVVSGLALLTRGLHLDGLADTADGLGSARSASEALEIMKRSDIGPFGVLTLVLVLLLQVSALAQLWGSGLGVSGVVVAVVAGRCAVTVACRQGVPAARATGLGAAVAGQVRRGAAFLVVMLTVGLSAGLVWLDGGDAWRGPVAVVVALALALVLEGHVVRRLGGITGDVLGALVEVATVTALLVLAT
jgi:adenosylcobinamide-GDP ribazoletransferase